jgi:hypothetical protein
VPRCPPQIPHALTWDQTRATTVESQRLTAWAMTWPYHTVNLNNKSYRVYILYYIRDNTLSLLCCVMVSILIWSNYNGVRRNGLSCREMSGE